MKEEVKIQIKFGGMAVIYRKFGRKRGLSTVLHFVMATASFNLLDFLGFRFFFYTAVGFFISVAVAIPILIYYPFSKWSRKSWLRFIKWRYPNWTIVEEVSVRGILDQGRNQGIYTLLLQGKSITDGVRSHLLQLTSTRPMLRSVLRKMWGFYGWRQVDEFRVENHLINASCSFKGRPITESNLQEFVNDVTSKFLSPNFSPWQVFVATCFLNGEETKVCIVRVHHLILRREHLTLADFLPLKYSSENWEYQKSDSPLTNLYSEPSALPRLHQMLTESFSNYWNEFLCNNDPAENPAILKKSIGGFQCVKIGVIVWVSTVKEVTRCYKKVDGFRFIEVFAILRREASKRNFRTSVIFWAFMNVVNPVEIFYSSIHWMWYICVTFILKTPILLVRELNALRSSQKHFHPDTLTSVLACYLPLVFQTIAELTSIAAIVVTAPKLILEELFFKSSETNHLQTISLCGRKIVAWSEEVEIETISKISSVTGASEAEILLAATAASFKEYFKQSGLQTPAEILVTAKFVSQRALFLRNQETRGVLCLGLPTKTPLLDDNPLETLQVIQENVHKARSKQKATYAISAAESSTGLVSSYVPSILLKLALLYLTRRYSLSLTHVDGDLPVEGVDAAMYWRPPQGYCSMSVTLHRHGGGVRLGVIGDAMIGPHHFLITKAFRRSVQELAVTVGVPRTPSRSRSPSPASPLGSASPTTSPGY
ncbi:uncharacterized protein LOC124176808 isoform X1 [Neodiprion fabricii]|uniref:uncharacterized protein LOC124176808 isoform X1 n=2 Tax=Neodiprion fabricii TaxID=2872261 RepID=UPI001ED93398|nr:uncharacterized protein LOC124176808 isoform X1 [Neodiprion fabricii]XP_046414471.1 uncharacterized protein LOC124176808 isoform X1 [Neodiprion fabricii]XP_046414472.1 uncharacterized protein LOC124176808 isoform X1 [Neodiprion fabricii]